MSYISPEFRTKRDREDMYGRSLNTYAFHPFLLTWAGVLPTDLVSWLPEPWLRYLWGFLRSEPLSGMKLRKLEDKKLMIIHGLLKCKITKVGVDSWSTPKVWTFWPPGGCPRNLKARLLSKSSTWSLNLSEQRQNLRWKWRCKKRVLILKIIFSPAGCML